MNGLLLVDKPSGWTSFDVVAKIRGMVKRETGLKKAKVGHAGTLDPLATGLLVILVGSYCKRASEFSKLDKVYKVTMKLGETSTTGDEEGQKTSVTHKKPTQKDLETALQNFVGEIEQIPHAFSAIKVDGTRAYELARAGKEVKLEPRKVTIHSISDVSYAYPEVAFTTKVSSGTYIRSLVEDIGKALSTGAYTSALRRKQIGEFNLEDAQHITDLDFSKTLTKHI